MIFDQQQRLIHALAEVKRRASHSTRMGTVAEVQQKGGQQKVRVEMGIDPDGKPYHSAWLPVTNHSSGGSSEQKQFEKGQNVRLSAVDGDFRMATVTAADEGKHAPQPKNAPKHGYGDSSQTGGKLFTGKWGPQPEKDQQQGGGGGQQQGGDKNHRNETWIASDDHAPPKHTGKAQVISGGGQEQSGQQEQDKELKSAVMSSVDEKNGVTHRVGEDVRLAAHSSGSKIAAGKTLFAAHKDKDAVMKSKQHSYIDSAKDVYVKAGDIPWVSKPWKIKSEEGKDGIPNDNMLGNSNGQGANTNASKSAQA